MAKIYYRRIKNGQMTIDDVPTRWREEVQALLDADVTPETLNQSETPEESNANAEPSPTTGTLEPQEPSEDSVTVS